MPISLSTDTSSLAHPTSENLLMLIIITGGLLFICILLLIIVVLRSKARRKKGSMPDQPKVVKEPKPKKEKKVKEVKQPVKPVVKEVVAEKTLRQATDAKVSTSQDDNKVQEIKKEVIEVVKKEEPKPIVEKIPAIETKVPEVKKEEPKKEEPKPIVEKIPVVETKVPEVKKEEPIVKVEEKKPEPIVIENTKKPEIAPANTTIEQKKKEFNKALEETHSKEDNLRILQERLAEISKDKKAPVSFTETPKKENTIDEAKVEEKKQVPHEKLVDLTALINEKLQAKTEPVKEPLKPIEQKKEESIVPVVKEEPKKEKPVIPVVKDEPKKEEPVVPIIKEEPKVEIKSEKESHEILSPFLNKITSNTEIPVEEKPEAIINKIDEELKTIAEKETEKPVEEKPVEEKQQDTTSQQKDQVPKTFTEWLNTLKK